jgi:hypothetical protein
MHFARMATVLACGLLVTSRPGEARADEPLEALFGAKTGIGTNLSGGPADLLGFAVGGTGGLSIYRFYAGVDIMHFFGGSATEGGVTYSASAWMGGVDLGYGFTIAMVTIRPQLGTGDLLVNSTRLAPSCVDCAASFLSKATAGVHNLYFEPGVAVLLAIGESAFVGVDANLFVLPHIVDESGDAPQTAVTFHAQVGVHF